MSLTNTAAEQPTSATKKDQIVERLRSLIVSGEIARGEWIRQNQLALLFDTSTTPVREALRQLEAEGIVVSSPHRGVRVASADINEVKGVYIARRLVEPYAMQRAVSRMAPRDVARASALNVEMREAYDANDGPAISRANRAFHFHFYEHCGVPALRDTIETLWLGFPWDILQVLSPRQHESVQEHEDILESFRKQDIDGVKIGVEAHLRNSYLALMGHLTHAASDIDPFELEND